MDDDTTKVVKEIIQNVIKSKKNLRMYPENNPIFIKTVDSAFTAFRDFLDYRNELVLKIKQLEIIHDGEQVYYNPEKDDNLSLFFFKDGIREISFKSGLQKQELEDFFKIIIQDLDKEDVEDDVVTLMWERDFQNIAYIVDETFLLDDEDYENIAVEQAKSELADEDEVLKAYEEAFSAEDAGYIPVVPLTDEDVQDLKKEIERDEGYYISKLVNLLYEMLFLAERKVDYQDLVSFFRSSIDYSLQFNHMEVATDILGKTAQVLNSERCPDTLKPFLRMILSYINSERVIQLLGDLLDSKTEFDEEAAKTLFTLMDKSALPPLLRILGELDTIHARKVIINALIILGKKDIATVAKGLNDNRWFVVRNIIYVLRSIGDKGAIEYLIKKLKHNDIRVRKEVIKALGELGSGDVVRYLKFFIGDADSSVRGLAARSLSQTGSPLAKKILLDELSSSSFKNKDFGEKKEFFESLSIWNDKAIIDFLIKILKKKSFFRKKKINENRACAAYALGLMGNKESLESLMKFKNEKNDLLHEYVHTAIKRIEHGATPERA